MPNDTTEEQAVQDEAEVRLSAKGSPKKVKEGLDQITGGGGEGSTKDNGSTGSASVSETMANPMNVVKVRRITPTEDQYGRIFQNYFELPCPQTRMNLEAYTREQFGGKNWHVDVVDEEGFKLTGYNFAVHELPKLIYEDKSRFGHSMGMPGMDPMMMGGNPMAMGGWPSLTGKDTGLDELDGIQLPQEEEEEPLEKWLERRTKRRIMMRDVEEMTAAGGNEGKKDSAEDDLAVVLDKITANTDKQIAAMQDATNKQIDALKETMKDEQRRREQKDAEDKHAQALKDQADRFERQLAELKADNKGKSPETTLLEVMRAAKDDSKVFNILADMNKTSQENFKDAIGMFTQNKPENALETVNQVMGAFGNMAQTFGFGKGDEELPFESRLLKTVNDVTPEVLKFLREERSKGRELTKEIVEEKIEQVTTGAMKDVKAEVRKAIAEQATKLMGDGGAAALTHEPAVPAAPPEPSAQAPAQPQQPAQEEVNTEQLAQMFNIQDDIAGRVNQALIVAGREMMIRPADAQWIDFVYDNFPEQIIAALANAKDPRTFFGIMGKYADKKILNHVVQIIIKDAQARAWMKEKAEEFKQGYLDAVANQRGEQPPPAPPVAPPTKPEEEFVDPHAGMAIDPSLGGGSETPVVFDAPGEATPLAPRPTAEAPPAPDGASGPLGSLPQAEVTQPSTAAGPLGGLEQAPPPSATPGPGPLGNLDKVAENEPPKKFSPKKAKKKASPKKTAKKAGG